MNATLKQIRDFGSIQPDVPSRQTSENAHTRQDATIGSYGRGIYAGRATYSQDFSSQGSYGRGIYAGHSTDDINFGTPGSYGRGFYSGRSTAERDVATQGSFASRDR